MFNTFMGIKLNEFKDIQIIYNAVEGVDKTLNNIELAEWWYLNAPITPKEIVNVAFKMRPDLKETPDETQ